ncbi:uncharacterized protein LOC132067078 [Lycium ferocissimum]|uniref:uncharacterized protein LOC132067078 n=1 Tax=Lycium ferocissimum TaxID=112874 RepID=UPI002815D3A0|nr:uncharacterized protein LOC132067078 [Lycium ferocissimum]
MYQLMRIFSLIGDTESSKKALAAWKQLCLPRIAGGLNILHIPTWNKAAICKMLWNLCKKEDKLWVRWVHAYYFKGQTKGQTIYATSYLNKLRQCCKRFSRMLRLLRRLVGMSYGSRLYNILY